MPINVTAIQLVAEIQHVLTLITIDQRRVDRTRRQLARLSAKGVEVIVEALARCELTAYLQQRFALDRSEVAAVINSSHTASPLVCLGHHGHPDNEEEWEGTWCDFEKQHPSVDTPGTDKRRRKADLFIALASGELVSIEFKYISPNTSLSVGPNTEQLARYLRRHVATIFFVYAAEPCSRSLIQNALKLRARFPRGNLTVVLRSGPRIRRL
jgi:hypothetical protein